ncbi:MAG: carboxypeptidase-like regulatory domain-containing protein [Bacteroidales bacterium]|nr:carboxypeptidase-like regulatory domain-containing protein [Bacteroidales bacterium]
MMKSVVGFTILILFFAFPSMAQNVVSFEGKVIDVEGNSIESAHIRNMSNNTGVISDKDGHFYLKIPQNKNVSIQVSCIGYAAKSFTVNSKTDQVSNFNIILEISDYDIGEVSVTGELSPESNLIKIEAKHIELNPDISGNLESLIKTMPGVSSNSELSSQYSVRGGNFDENLVYVNGIEIYRPMLVRSGQQEGLSFLNSDMVSSIHFSSGGFETRFGDKMSSVLDIRYTRPVDFAASVTLSFLGGAVHVEDASKNGKFTYNTGFRYKTSQYVLNSLETKGDYNPEFYDFQTYFTYKVNNKLDFDFLGYYSLNSYQFVPVNRKTSFGTIDEALNLNIYYDGNEKDRFETYLGAFTSNYNPNENLSFKLIFSAFRTYEEETYDIQGQYYLNELDNTIGSDTYGDSIMNIGVGTFLNHARNYLTASVYSAFFKGGYYKSNNRLRWGAKYNYEVIDDVVNQWEMLDSAGYSLPNNGSTIELYESARATNIIYSNRVTGYVQNTYNKKLYNNADFYFNIGVRANYWDFNKELNVTPRMSISYKPDWKKDMLFRFASGFYYQPPFYKEMKNADGVVNPDIKSQKSIHFVLGNDYNFSAWNRPFKVTTEIYYKILNDLIPYKIDNVHLEYSAENMAKGYAYGIDFKINGEFVQGIESWASLSLMQTKEDIDGDFYYDYEGQLIEPGYYARPTDQLVNFSMYFQDYLPMNPSYRMNLSLHYGSRLPFSSPEKDRYDQVYRMRPYKRVDMGFSKVIIKKDKEFKTGSFLNVFEDMWISFEIFNLLDINNTISYMWVKTVSNQAGNASQYAVPNYLTSRRFNLKLTIKF